MRSASTQKGVAKGPDVVQGAATISDDNWRGSSFMGHGLAVDKSRWPVFHSPFTRTSRLPTVDMQALGLPSDWIVHATPSGYQDRDGFLKVGTEFVEYCGPKRPQYVFMDGHHSHFDSEALDLLASKHVYVFFLKLNNSEEGQPTTTDRTDPL